MSSKYGDTNSPNSRMPGRPGRDDPPQRGNQQNIPPPKNEEEIENAAEIVSHWIGYTAAIRDY